MEAARPLRGCRGSGKGLRAGLLGGLCMGEGRWQQKAPELTASVRLVISEAQLKSSDWDKAPPGSTRMDATEEATARTCPSLGRSTCP